MAVEVPISTAQPVKSEAVPSSAELLGNLVEKSPNPSPIVDVARRLARHHDAQWLAEDQARALAHDDGGLAAIKRQIDAMNMTRSEFIDEIDSWVADHVSQNPAASLHTETLGSVIDRLCIAVVRANRLREVAHIQSRGELARYQLAELAAAYDLLIREILDGSRRVPNWKTLKSYGETGTAS